jgi:23S rRNA (guanosine2251-2'-O)-methyltransferase
MKFKTKREVYLILDNLRSVYNTGAIFRIADACRVSKIFLSGFTPSPQDRFGRLRKDFAKTALGTEKSIFWEKVISANKLLKKLKQLGFKIIAVEQSKNSIDYKKVRPTKCLALVFGNETNGLPKSVLSLCDVVAEIPMKGKKESLNVSVAAGIALFRILGL